MATNEEVKDFLSHHGIKGMHWGVRKDRGIGSDSQESTKSTESRSLRRQAAVNYSKVTWDRTKNESIFGPEEMTRAEYNALSTKGEKFVKGTQLKRVALDPKFIDTGATFVSRLDKDAAFYRASIPAEGPNTKRPGPGSKKYEDSYELTLKTTKTLTLPSPKARVDAFTELMNKPVVVNEKGEKVTGRAYLESIGYKRVFKQLDDQQAGLKAYRDFVHNQGSQNMPLNSPYFNNLRAKGYNALLDENDAGLLTKAPLILLDAKGTATVVGVDRLTADKINAAQRSLIPSIDLKG
jgi:hypothetical protein